MKTIKERLMELPDGYRELALKNMYEGGDEMLTDSLSSALNHAFHRHKTREGLYFRVDVDEDIRIGRKLPPFPLPEKTYKMKQPTMRLNNGEEYPVASLVWMDGGKTLRAFPEKKLKKGEIKSYVIYTENPEESDVGAVLVC